jgi:hypothetical protein
MATLTSRLVVSAIAELTNAFDLAPGRVPLEFTKALDLASGTGLNQADRIFHDQRTLAASASEDLDLAGGLTDAFGATLTFARVKGLIIVAAAANTNNVVIGNATANAFVGPFGAATHTLAVRPGGVLALFAPDATAYAVTAGTGDLLKVLNSAGGTSVTYDLIIVGASS